jgi:hypothetical protein
MILRLTALVLLACAPITPAQQGAPAPSVPGLRVRGLSFQLDAPPAVVFAHPAGAPNKEPGVPLDLKSYLNHEFSSLPSAAYDLVFTTAADPASVARPAALVARARIPAGFTRGILMFLPGGGQPGDPPFRVLVIGDTPREFPTGSVKILNLSPQPVRIRLENQNFDFKSGENGVIENPPVADNNSSGMTAFAYGDNAWRRIASGAWPHPGGKRVLQVLFLNPATRQTEIRGVRDVAAVE